MNEMSITEAQYVNDNFSDGVSSIICVIGGQTLSVPLDPKNTHYAEIMRQVEAGTLTIADAE